MQKKKPLLSVRPHFHAGLAIVQVLPATLVATVLITAVAGTLLHILFSAAGLTRFVTGGAIYLSLFLLSASLFPAACFELKKKALRRTAYHFYEGYMEFQNFRFFLNRRRGRVRYGDIADVTQHAGFLEGLNGLTTIYLYVPGMGYQTSEAFSGVRMSDIPEGLGLASRIIDVIERGGAGKPASPDPAASVAPA